VERSDTHQLPFAKMMGFARSDTHQLQRVGGSAKA
jgi:hypothetical protein